MEKHYATCTWPEWHRESQETAMTCDCDSCSFLPSASWASFVTQIFISLFLPHRRMYNPMITTMDPNKLLI